MADPHRPEITDLPARGPFSVEQIAGYTGMLVANAAQPLQTLKNARLVSITRNGNVILYILTGDNVLNTRTELREPGLAYNAAAARIIPVRLVRSPKRLSPSLKFFNIKSPKSMVRSL